MKRTSAKRAAYNGKFVAQLREQIESRLGPKTETLLDQFSQRIAPTVARLHQWCESRTPGQGGQTKSRKRKSQADAEE